MIGKGFAFILLTAAACVVGTAQSPEPIVKGEPQTFSFSFNGDGGYLGIQTEEVTKENFSKFGLREVRGVAVGKVLEGSPAQTAGFQNGDVIVKIDGEDISSSRKLTRLVSEIAPDHQARVTVLRGGSERDITVTLGKRPEPKFGPGAFAFPPMGKFEMPDAPNAPDMPDLEKLPRVQMAPRAPG
ncbi:MAG TPA: PDZ domain-containing protein, partial [Pyrinomonadaceae bacterium]|nr:PDZ domain-containing protein [Pyrinomonadaceae bacterium]